MSTGSSSVNGTTIVSGPDVIQRSDFFVSAGILHPVTVGSIAVIVLFSCLRVGSNRSIAPITIFDWLINVALGSTLAGIVNGNSLVRGLLALGTMLGFQYVTSTLSTRFHRRLGWIFQSPPLVIVFRGKMLTKVMTAHRISVSDVQASLRGKGLLNVCEVECGIIEPNGTISIFSIKTLEDAKVEPDVLMAVPAYKALCEQAQASGESSSTVGRDEEKGQARKTGQEASGEMDDVAGKCC